MRLRGALLCILACSGGGELQVAIQLPRGREIIRFDDYSDLDAVAAEFVTAHWGVDGLNAGNACADAPCVARAVAERLRAERARAARFDASATLARAGHVHGAPAQGAGG